MNKEQIFKKHAELNAMKKRLKSVVNDFWSERLGSQYASIHYFLYLKTDPIQSMHKIAGFQQGRVIVLNLDVIKNMQLDPEVVLAHEYGHLIGMPVVNGDIMDERAEIHIRKELSDYEKH